MVLPVARQKKPRSNRCVEHNTSSDGKPMKITKEISTVYFWRTVTLQTTGASSFWTLCGLLSNFSVAPCNSALQ